MAVNEYGYETQVYTCSTDGCGQVEARFFHIDPRRNDARTTSGLCGRCFRAANPARTLEYKGMTLTEVALSNGTMGYSGVVFGFCNTYRNEHYAREGIDRAEIHQQEREARAAARAQAAQ